MAELIAGSGKGGGLKGLAPGVEVVAVRTSLKGANDNRESDSAEAIRAAADSKAQIISMSISSDLMYPDEEEAVKYASSKGKLLFASVGNEAEKKNFIGYPAAYPSAIGISAADKSGKVGKFSEFGKFVDLAAPGLDIPQWCNATFRSYCDGGSGTSAATALASASAALIWAKHPNWTANQVLRVLIDTASRSWPKDEPSDYLGYGLVRPSWHLLKNKGNPGPPDIDPITNKKTPGVGSVASGSSKKEPSTPPSQPPKDAGDSKPAAAVKSSRSGEDDGGPMWIVAGSVAAAVVIGGAAFALVRKRRNA